MDLNIGNCSGSACNCKKRTGLFLPSDIKRLAETRPRAAVSRRLEEAPRVLGETMLFNVVLSSEIMSRRDHSRASDCVLSRGLLYNRVASSADGAAAMSSPDSGLGTAKLALDRFQVAHARRMAHEEERGGGGRERERRREDSVSSFFSCMGTVIFFVA